MSKSFHDLIVDMQAKKVDLTSKETAATEAKRISDQKSGEVVMASQSKSQSESDFGKALNRFNGFSDPSNKFISGTDEAGKVVLYQPSGGDKFNMISPTSDTAEVPDEVADEEPITTPTETPTAAGTDPSTVGTGTANDGTIPEHGSPDTVPNVVTPDPIAVNNSDLI